ncbi:MAG: ABC transporter ATP-binding protein [Propionibacteriaceae bacterium]|jgi:ABC-2 type transport system ATP-binding protein|nr:ABC transporter ATP-binding protein [Propionibacteriaceae bacterium]
MIEFDHVTKRYGGVNAIDRVCLRLPDHGIHCLLGRNGAGKTTWMKLLAGHIGATSGAITVDGRPVSPGRMPESVNYIESGVTQFNLRVSELMAAAADLQQGFDQGFAQEMADRLELDRRKRFKQLSFGMRTMLTTIIALANSSRAILLDEPTLGFDAIMRQQFNDLLLQSHQAHPRLIVVSTHLIDEIAKVTERLIVIDRGRVLLQAGIDQVDELAYSLSGPTAAVQPLLAGLNVIGRTSAGALTTAQIYDHRITPPPGVVLERLSLQDFFINLVGGGTHV